MTARPRLAPYRREELRALYDPRTIAMIGASPRPGSFGARTAANLAGFDGHVFLINEKYPEIGGKPCFPALSALPERPDLAVVTTPASTVETVIDDCVAAGVPSVMVYASGFAETSDVERAALQARIVRKASDGGTKVLGPNCVGLLNYTSGALVTFATTPERRRPTAAAIGLVSQSGAIGLALAQAQERGVSFSHVLTSGNSSDVDTADWVAALAEDPACAVIACIFEGVPEPLRLLEAARLAWARDKPLIIYKLATGETGAAAAVSHTGSLAGSAASWRALFESAHAIVVNDYEDLVETAAFFGKARAPKARGVAILASSGGAAILGADCAERHGVPLPQPLPATRTVLESRIPSFGSPRNPCDVTAQVLADPAALMDCAGALLSDPNYSTLVYAWTYAYAPATERLPRISAVAAAEGKPVCAVWLTQRLEGHGTELAEADPNVAVFRSMDRCFAALSAWTARAESRARPPADTAIAAPNANLPAGAAVLGERHVKSLLATYGVAVSRDTRVIDAEGAARAAESIGGAVVLKIESPDIAHKTEAGGVVLNVVGGAAAREAFRSIMTACARAAPGARLDGVIVAEMVPAGVELLIGIKNEAAFGPIVVVGLGGILAELVRDTVTALAPIDELEALALLTRLRGAAILDGFRGSAPVDRAALARTISRISRLAFDLKDRLSELDVNPLICRGDQIVAVDGLAVLR